MVNCKHGTEYHESILMLIHLLGIIRIRRGIQGTEMRLGYKIAQRARREDSMLGSRIGTLILLWVAEAPQRPSGELPRT
jgi:hypothetical protein